MTDREWDDWWAKIDKARQAIVASIGEWKRGGTHKRGRIDCPVCGKANALAYRRAALSGHLAACCVTPGCVEWIE